MNSTNSSMGRVASHLDVDGCQLAYKVGGAGPPVLFIQGIGVHGDAWAPQTDALSESFRCLSFDNRGMGQSQPATPGLTVTRMALDSLALIAAQGWESAHIVGHSLGGLVAAEIALTMPARVRSLALLCTFADGRAAASSVRMMWIGARTRIGTRRMRRHAFLEIVYPPDHLRSGDRDELARRTGEFFGHDLADTPPVTGAQLRAMRAHDVTSRIHQLAGLPALVVSAEHDPIAPPSLASAWTAGLPDARVVTLPDTAHGAPIQRPAEVNDLLREHLFAAEERFERLGPFSHPAGPR